MTLAKRIRSRINHLEYNQEYTSAIFEDIANRETVKKTLQRSRDIIGKTSNKKFYRKYLSDKIDDSPYEIYDDVQTALFDPDEYTFNCFWQNSKTGEQKVSAIIRNYLSTMNPDDIHTLCKNYGRNRIKSELVQKYKEIYANGSINVKGLEIKLSGRYDRNPAFAELMDMIDDC